MYLLLDPFTKRTIDIIDYTIKKKELQKEDITQIIMVGYSTKLSCVHSALIRYFGEYVTLKFDVSSKEVVALGATTLCHIWSENERM